MRKIFIFLAVVLLVSLYPVAVNAATSSGVLVTFTPAVATPSVSTTDASSVLYTTATLNGNIISVGGENCDQRGFEWGTVPGVYVASNLETGNFTAGSITYLSGTFIVGTTYYFRAKAHNSWGWAYGSELSFTTLLATVPVVTTLGATGIGNTSATLNGSYTSGGATVDQYGFAWGTAPGMLTTAWAGVGNMTPFSYTYLLFAPATTYYFQAVAHNSLGWGYGGVMSFSTSGFVGPSVDTMAASSVNTVSADLNGNITAIGSSNIASRGFEYGLPANPSANFVADTGNWTIGTYTKHIIGLSPDTTYNFRAVVTDESEWDAYGGWLSFTTSPTATPTPVPLAVTTQSASGISTTYAQLNGIISGSGTATIRGFDYGSTAGIYPYSVVENGSFTTGTYYGNATGLTASTTWYFRAKIYSGGWIYGSELSFTTSAEGPVTYLGYLDIIATGNCTVDYDYLPLFTSLVNQTTIAAYVNSSDTNTAMTVYNGGAIPYLPVSDRTAFVVSDFSGKSTQTLRYYLGTSVLQSSFYTVVGYGGNLTTSDQVALEPGNTFQFDMYGILDTSAGSNKNILYKQDAIRIYVSAANTITATIGNDTAPTKTISYSPVASGEHLLQLVSDGTTFGLFIDGTLKASTSASLVGNNTNDWYLMGNNSMPAMYYYRESVGNVSQVWYQPNSYVVGTTVPDRQNSFNGTINWGTNPSCVVVSVGGIDSSSIPPEGTGLWVPPSTDIAGSYGTGNGSQLPFYETFYEKSLELGMPDAQPLYLIMMLGVATAIGLGVLVFTGSMMISIAAVAVTIFAGANTGILSIWMAITFIFMSISVVYLSRQT